MINLQKLWKMKMTFVSGRIRKRISMFVLPQCYGTLCHSYIDTLD